MGGTATFSLVMLLRHDGGNPPSRQSAAAKKTPNHGKHKNTATPSLIRWSIQKVRRIANSLESESNPHMSSYGLSGVERTRRSLNARTSSRQL
jgi:hypothetical protein